MIHEFHPSGIPHFFSLMQWGAQHGCEGRCDLVTSSCTKAPPGHKKNICIQVAHWILVWVSLSSSLLLLVP